MRKRLHKTLKHAWSASLILLSLSFLPFSAQSQCDYKIVGYDSFGDGWNGASIDVDVAGAVTNFTLANGSIDSISIASYSGDITTFTFNSGSFDSEITFDIYAPDGTLLGNYGPSPSAGLFLTDTSNSVCTAPSCLAPLGLTLNNLSIDSASISWSAAGATPTNGFDYQLVPGGNGIGVGVVASGNSSSASQVITGLNGNTSYDFYVRSNCGNNDTSSYAGPLSFTTFPDTAQGVACSASNNSSILFSEEFDNNNAGWTGDINSSNGSWEIPDGSTSSNTGADNAYSGSSYMNYEASSTSANSGSITSPAIDLSTAADDAELSFWMHAYGASMGTLEIGVGTSSSGPFTTEFTWTGPLQTSGSAAWVNVGVDLSSYLGQTIYIQLTQHDTLNNLGSGFDGDMSIDLFEVSTCVGCAIPSGLTSTNITPSAADLNWTENGSATSWEISYGSPGFTPGAGTQTVVTNRPFSLSNLTSNTNYDWYVRAICGPGDTSAWSGLNNFTTSCPAFFTAPYSQNFDGTTDPNIDACWSTLNTTSSSSAWVETENSSFDPQRSAPNAIEFYNSSGSGGELLLISPQLSDLDSTKQVAFYAQDEGSSSYTSGLVVGTMSDPTDAATFHPYDSIPNSMLDDTWQRFVITFDTLTGNDQYIAIGHDQDDSFDYIFLDNLEYTTIPTCPKPTNLTVGQITANDAQVTFTQGGNATDFNIAYGSTGFSLGSGTQVSVTNDTATLSGLSPQTSYDVYVRDSCAAGDVSQWVGPVTFTTACLPLGLPYSEDFTAGFPTCWTRSNSIDVIIDSACGINNSNYLRVDGVAGVNATTPLLDASGAASVQATWSYRAACNNAPESGDAINVDYWNGSSWVTIKTYDGSTAPTTWTADTATVPGGNSDFQIRFDMQSGSGSNFDDYDFDSLSVDVNCIPYTAPITESFDSNSDPVCWSSYEASGSGWEYGQNGSAGYAAGNASERTGNGGYYAWIDFSLTDDSTNLETYEVDVSALTTPSVAFDLFSYNTNDNSTNILYVEAWNGSNWVQADSLRGDLGGWQRQYVDLSSYTYGSNLVKVRFRGESGGSSTDYYNDLLIDEVTFDELPSCLPSTGLRQLSATDTSATVTWDAGGSAINYLVEYGSPGFTPGTGTVITASNDTVTITGLTAGTTYDFYVTDSCGANDLSTQAGPGIFITDACLASAQCSYTLNLYDTFGDGWNGNEVDVFQGGANSGSFGASFTGGDSLTGLSLALCPNQTIDLILNEGSFSSEIEFFVINPAGDTVASHLASSSISDGDTLASFTTAPAANAGMSGSDTVCTSAGSIDLTSYLGTYDQGGSWADLSGSGALTDSLFDASAVGSGTYNFTYLVSSNSGCSVDSSGVTITVQSPSNAGAMAADTLCDTAMVVDLNNYLDTTADAGGSWVDVNGTGALSGSDFDPSMVTPNATYDFRYVVSAPCGADSTTVSLYVAFCSSSIEEYLNGQVSLFPNPAQDVVNIETTGTLTNMAVTVYDAHGKALIRTSVPTNGTEQLDVSALPAGMYTVSIQSDQGMAVKRFVKE